MKQDILSYKELAAIESEIDAIDAAEVDLDNRLPEIMNKLKRSYRLARMLELGITVIEGGK